MGNDEWENDEWGTGEQTPGEGWSPQVAQAIEGSTPQERKSAGTGSVVVGERKPLGSVGASG